jgi:hypothetical protein
MRKNNFFDNNKNLTREAGSESFLLFRLAWLCPLPRIISCEISEAKGVTSGVGVHGLKPVASLF